MPEVPAVGDAGLSTGDQDHAHCPVCIKGRADRTLSETVLEWHAKQAVKLTTRLVGLSGTTTPIWSLPFIVSKTSA
jgi:hypothetical protein